MLLIRNKLNEFIKCIDMDTEGQIWIQLNFLTEYKLGGVYIPPPMTPRILSRQIWVPWQHTLSTLQTSLYWET